VKILLVSDVEDQYLWDYYQPGRLSEYGLILSAGDLKANYLSFLVTMARCPVMYVHGNHDTTYDKFPPEGCDCIDDELVVYRGLRILGLGGCRRYSGGSHQYTEKEMEKRVRRLRRKIDRAGGVDIILTHAPARGLGDDEDPCHIGFEIFNELIEKYHPAYFVHGHVHLNYKHNSDREMEKDGTRVINASGKYVIEIELPENADDLPAENFGARLKRHLRIFAD